MSSRKFCNKDFRASIHSKCNGRCAYCGDELPIRNLYIDHVIPKRRKMNQTVHGSDEYENLYPSCQSCNISKSSMDLEKWRTQLSLKVERLERDESNFRIALRYGVIQKTDVDIIFYFEKIKDNAK